jgi:hypothetical protein
MNCTILNMHIETQKALKIFSYHLVRKDNIFIDNQHINAELFEIFSLIYQ